MLWKRRPLPPLADRGPLRVVFACTSMPVGGAETLVLNLMRRLDRQAFLPELCCLKEPGVLGEVARCEFPLHAGLLRHKYDVGVLPRLARLLRRRRIDALVTVGAGDKMFWGRLAACWERVPVVLCAIHSTGWPDAVGRLNRALTPITDAFIAVAEAHGRYLVEQIGFPAGKVRVIPNGIDVHHFRPLPHCRGAVRGQLGIAPHAPVCGIVAALRPEKNHLLFLRAASLAQRQMPEAEFLVVGDGPERQRLEEAAREAGLGERVRFLGCRRDVPELLSAVDIFSLTSDNEASPVSVLEAMACGLPVVATRVGSLEETVVPENTGFLVPPGDAEAMAARWLDLFRHPERARRMGVQARQRVTAGWSIQQTVAGYERLIEEVYQRKSALPNRRCGAPLPLCRSTR